MDRAGSRAQLAHALALGCAGLFFAFVVLLELAPGRLLDLPEDLPLAQLEQEIVPLVVLTRFVPPFFLALLGLAAIVAWLARRPTATYGLLRGMLYTLVVLVQTVASLSAWSWLILPVALLAAALLGHWWGWPRLRREALLLLLVASVAAVGLHILRACS